MKASRLSLGLGGAAEVKFPVVSLAVVGGDDFLGEVE